MENEINGYPILKHEDRKKILLLSDDIRTWSGVATVSKEIVKGTCHYFNWIQIGGLQNHPDAGKIINMDSSIRQDTGVEDATMTIYPSNGYGNIDMLRAIIDREKPDAIMHFTDPRYWVWLYAHEREIRQTVPIIFYTIWDDLPYPLWNRPYYDSCDSLLCISKQTKNVVENVLGKERSKNKIIEYVPHGINPNVYKPLNDNSSMDTFKSKILQNKEYDFIIFYNSRNIRRKMVSDMMIAFKQFKDRLPIDKQDKIALILKTAPIDDNGTDLVAISKDLLKDSNIIFIPQGLDQEQMNYLYNIADVTMTISSAEGFGLSFAESIMAGTPTISNCIGGLQDQMRFEDENGNWIDLNPEHPTNSDGKYLKHGEWTFGIWPQLNLTGSPPTPYIYDSRAAIDNISEKMYEVYNIDWIDRRERGLKGREWMLSEESKMSSHWMCNGMIKYINKTIEVFKPRDRYSVIKVKNHEKLKNTGVYNKIKNRWE